MTKKDYDQENKQMKQRIKELDKAIKQSQDAFKKHLNQHGGK